MNVKPCPFCAITPTLSDCGEWLLHPPTTAGCLFSDTKIRVTSWQARFAEDKTEAFYQAGYNKALADVELSVTKLFKAMQK